MKRKHNGSLFTEIANHLACITKQPTQIFKGSRKEINFPKKFFSVHSNPEKNKELSMGQPY